MREAIAQSAPSVTATTPEGPLEVSATHATLAHSPPQDETLIIKPNEELRIEAAGAAFGPGRWKELKGFLDQPAGRRPPTKPRCCGA